MPSYEKNKASGLWSARFRETDELGNTKQKRLSGFKTKKEAQYGYEDYIKNKEDEKAKKDLAPEELALLYAESKLAGSWEILTVETKENFFTLHLRHESGEELFLTVDEDGGIAETE